MTASERLRELLDERGVEWGNIRRDGSESNYLTEWQLDDNQGIATAIEWAVGGGLSVEIHRHYLTPEQAIAATLGAGTCHDAGGSYAFICSECGCRLDVTDIDGEPTMWLDGMATVPRYCPNCGRRVTE